MARLNQDLNQSRRWERREAERASDLFQSGEWAVREKVGRVVVLRDQHKWSCNDTIVVKDRRSMATLLTFRFSYGQEIWELWAGMAPDPVPQWGYERIPSTQVEADGERMCAWDRAEFAQLFCEALYRETLDSVLTLIRCPSCTSWTGGGTCFQCASKAARNLYDRMSNV